MRINNMFSGRACAPLPREVGKKKFGIERLKKPKIILGLRKVECGLK
jgi:hypothetical protein